MDDENLKIIACDPIKNTSMKWEEISRGILKCEMTPLHWYEIILTYYNDVKHILSAHGQLYEVIVKRLAKIDCDDTLILNRNIIDIGDVQYLTRLALKEYYKGLQTGGKRHD